MHRIDSQGAVAVLPSPEPVGDVIGFFTEGDPSNAIPATVVSADWANAVQEELVAVVLAGGLDLDKTNRTQVRDAILALIENAPAIATFEIANDQSTPSDITGLVFDSADFKSAIIEIDITRKTATQEVRFVGRMEAIHYESTGWQLIAPTGVGDVDDYGVEFDIDNSTGQVSYTSNELTGGSYVGELRVKVSRFKA